MTQARYRIIDATTPGVPRDHDRFNVNGPSVLPAPGWMPDPPGRYLMFFAHHVGQSIRLAAADEPTGPWRMVDPDVLKPVPRGLATTHQNGLRDPFVLADGGRRWLCYAAAGEDALGVTEIAGL